MAVIELADTRGGERDLLAKVLLNAIANGNTVNPEAFDPTPEEYKLLCGIMCKLNDTCKKGSRK